MLNTFRNIAGSFGAKIMLLMLVISFVIWGVGDVLRSSGHNPVVATVGKTEITAADFLRAQHRETENLRNSLGASYTPELTKNKMFTDWILKQLINNALLRQEADALGIVPDDTEIVRHIRAETIFHDEKDNFDRKIFEARLANIGVSEKEYVNTLREEISARILTDTITANLAISQSAVKLLTEAKQERRAVTLYRLTSAIVPAAVKPDDTQIKAYYEKHTDSFILPEYRNLSYIHVTSKDLREHPKLSPEELKALYEERIQEFKTPEQRDVDQLLFKTKADAQKAQDMLSKKNAFKEVAKLPSVTNKESIAMGKIQKKNLIKAAEEAVFALAEGGVTDPIESPFGWHIFHVKKIYPPGTLSMEEARPALEEELEARHSEDALPKLAHAMEDSLASGNTLIEAAKEHGLTVVTVGPIDHLGNGTDGKENKQVPSFDRFLETAFKTEEKSESPAITLKDGSIYFVRVDSIIPSRPQTMTEAKNAIIDAIEKDQRNAQLAGMSTFIGDKFSSDPQSIVKQYDLFPYANAAIRNKDHTIAQHPVPDALIKEIFSVKPPKGTHAYSADDGTFLIAQVNDILPFNADSKDPKANAEITDTHKSLITTVQNEILEQYTRYLMKKYPVTIHDHVLQTVTQ